MNRFYRFPTIKNEYVTNSSIFLSLLQTQSDLLMALQTDQIIWSKFHIIPFTTCFKLLPIFVLYPKPLNWTPLNSTKLQRPPAKKNSRMGRTVPFFSELSLHWGPDLAEKAYETYYEVAQSSPGGHLLWATFWIQGGLRYPYCNVRAGESRSVLSGWHGYGDHKIVLL